jgi:DNA repair exonuclease SbcCD ATPase subunit
LSKELVSEMSRRGRSGSAFSLFSFQDIITSVTAVIILITLILAIELINRQISAAGQTSTADERSAREPLDAAIRDAEQEIKELEQRLESERDLVVEAAQASPEQIKRDVDAMRSQITSLDREWEALMPDQRAARAQENDAQQRKNAKASSDEQKAAQLRVDVLRKRKEISRLKLENRLVYNPASGTSKHPWIIEVSDKGFRAASLTSGNSELKQVWSGPRASSLLSWTKGRDPLQEAWF